MEKKIIYKEVVEERLIEGATDEEIKAFADAMDEAPFSPNLNANPD